MYAFHINSIDNLSFTLIFYRLTGRISQPIRSSHCLLGRRLVPKTFTTTPQRAPRQPFKVTAVAAEGIDTVDVPVTGEKVKIGINGTAQLLCSNLFCIKVSYRQDSSVWHSTPVCLQLEITVYLIKHFSL